jgi:DNA-binding NarL/FixJ family response regulator
MLLNNLHVCYRQQKLSKRQVSILLLIAEGLPNAEIARILYLSKRTVETYINRIKRFVARQKGYRIADRELVVFAMEMVRGLEQFKEAKLIEDWD